MLYTGNIGNSSLVIGETQTCSSVKPVNRHSPLDNWIVNGNTYINKIIKFCTDSPPFQKTITNMNDNINMDSTIAVSMNACS
jgi:hypothetical protein